MHTSSLFSFLLFVFLSLSLLFSSLSATASAPLNINVTLRGKKYPMQVSKISEIYSIIEEKSGLKSDQQALLFKGKMLPRGQEKEEGGEEADLSSFGVEEGGTLNIVPQKTQKQTAPTATSTFGSSKDKEVSPSSSASSSSSNFDGGNPFAAFGANQAEIFAKVREILGDETLSIFNDVLPENFPRNPEELTPERLEELQTHLQNLPPDQQQKLLQAQQQMIVKLLRSPLIEEYLTDDNLEFIRQRLLTLPEVKDNLPAMVMEILQDATKFKESIKQLIDVYRMMPEGGFPGMGGGMPGMGGGGMPGMGGPTGMGGGTPDFSGASNPFGSSTDTSSASGTSKSSSKDGVDDLPEDDKSEL